jgi:Peptidase propeptide and YPEB domain
MKMLPSKMLCAVAATALLYAFLAQPAHADRIPTQEERSRIEQSLRGLGFQSWGEIELDDGQWEIKDAQHEDGKKYELKLNLETLQVEKQKEEH